ncbi:MAG: choice-of-anchor D domain-containing protein, partial [Armatimonadetes bacterium]|nr:choice-of-anchor D domain-containing protein [Armatimonadota bacterium]
MPAKSARCVVVILPLLVGAVFLSVTHAHAGDIYVDAAASGANNGTSWANAYTDLQVALTAAVSGDTINVAKGTYKPTTGSNRSATFQLKSGVTLLGGYPTGGGTRDPAANVTTLSGDIGGAGSSDNSYHVVTGSGTNNTAVLDGFTITGGNANGGLTDIFGGGMYNDQGSPALTNVTFSGNSASNAANGGGGGGLCNTNSSSPTLMNVTFSGNSVPIHHGGGMANYWSSSPTLTNVTFSGNSARANGGGLYNYSNCNATLTNVTFSGNSAYSGGGACNVSSNPILTNVTFSGNSATNGGGVYNYGSSPTLTNVTWNGNTASAWGGAMYSYYGSSPIVRNSILWGDTPEETAGGYGSGPTYTYCVYQGGSGANIITTDPKLGALGNYGGFTQTIPLLAGSSAIDAANDTWAPATDQRGVTRPQGAHADIGAYEAAPTPEINIKQGTTNIADSGSYDFGGKSVGTDTDIVFTIENTGSASLTLTTPLTITGANADQFSLQAQPTSPVAGPTGTTTFTVRFSPTSEGAKTATISIANNDSDENPYDFAIQGTGTAPEMDVQGNSVSIADGDTTPTTADHTDFGPALLVGGTVDRTFTIANTGSASLNLTGTPMVSLTGTNAADFSVTTQPTSPVAANGSTTFTVHFDPSALGLRTATLSIANDDSDESPYDFALQGTGTAPEMDVKGNSVSISNGDTTPSTSDHTDFGAVEVMGGTQDRTFTIKNEGTAILNLTGNPLVSLSGDQASDFSVTVTPTTTISPGGETTVTVRFDPSAIGLRQATISIANDDADENPYNFAIWGSATTREMDVQGGDTPTSIPDEDVTPSLTDYTDFGSVSVDGGTVTRTFTIRNTGNLDLNLTGDPKVALSGDHAADFSVISLPTSPLLGSGSTTFAIRFNPSAVGVRTATVSLANDDLDENPYNFTIQGTGTAPEMSLKEGTTSIADSGSYNFGNKSVNSNTDVVFTIENTGTADLTLTTPLTIGGTNADQFSLQTPLATTPVAAGGNTTFTVRFTPTSTGAKTATISIANNDSDENPYNLTITGTGTVPEMNLKQD